jgi:hypothetical protein
MIRNELWYHFQELAGEICYKITQDRHMALGLPLEKVRLALICGKTTGVTLMAGIGVMSYEDGSYYVGSFFNEKKNGIGIFVDKNGNYTCGEWSFDKFIK